MPALAEAFRGGARVEDTAGSVARRFGIEPRLARNDDAGLWRRGVLDDLAGAEEIPQGKRRRGDSSAGRNGSAAQPARARRQARKKAAGGRKLRQRKRLANGCGLTS